MSEKDIAPLALWAKAIVRNRELFYNAVPWLMSLESDAYFLVSFCYKFSQKVVLLGLQGTHALPNLPAPGQMEVQVQEWLDMMKEREAKD